MAEDERPQLYLITPPQIAPQAFSEQLSRLLDICPVACLRLDLASHDPDEWSRAADAIRGVAHVRDIPVVIAGHIALAQRLGLDGVHLDDLRNLRKARTELGPDAILGAFCGTSRHDGLTAGEAGADYVGFGPVGETGLGDGELALDETFAWWSEMIELPVVAEGGLDPAAIARLAPVTDFFALGPEIWRAEDPASALREAETALNG